LQVTTASKNQGRHAQSVEDIIRVSMQSTQSEALFQHACFPKTGMPPFGMEIAANAAANPCHSHCCCPLPACITSCLVAVLKLFKISCFQDKVHIGNRLAHRLGWALRPLFSLQIAHHIQCSCNLVPTCWISTHPLPPHTKLYLGAGACHGHCSSFKAEQELGWAAC